MTAENWLSSAGCQTLQTEAFSVALNFICFIDRKDAIHWETSSTVVWKYSTPGNARLFSGRCTKWLWGSQPLPLPSGLCFHGHKARELPHEGLCWPWDFAVTFTWMCQSCQGTGTTRGWRILCGHTLVCGLHVGIGPQLLPETAASDEFLNPSFKKTHNTTGTETRIHYSTRPDHKRVWVTAYAGEVFKGLLSKHFYPDLHELVMQSSLFWQCIRWRNFCCNIWGCSTKPDIKSGL